MRLKNKVALVTASTRGIGYAIVESFVKEGALVYMAARNLDMANELADSFNKNGVCVKTVYCDATVFDSYSTMVEEVIKNEGRLDILVNNYGGSNPKIDMDITKTNYTDFNNTIDTNLASVFISSQSAINKAMIPQNSGTIINIGSVAGLTPDVSQCGYGTAKAGIIHLSKMIAVQVAKHNIRCNVVCPGMTATDAVTSNLSDDFKEFFLKHTPIKRMGTPEEIAGAVMYYACDDSAYTSGQVTAVHGGFGLATPIYGDMLMMTNKR